jgi:hypothetical protein
MIPRAEENIQTIPRKEVERPNRRKPDTIRTGSQNRLILDKAEETRFIKKLDRMPRQASAVEP